MRDKQILTAIGASFQGCEEDVTAVLFRDVLYTTALHL